MSRGAVILWLASGCGFQPVDAQSDANVIDIDGHPPADTTSCVGGVVNLCSQPAPTTPYTLTGTIDTDSDARCIALAPTICLIYGTSILVNGGLAVTGSRALALASTSTLMVNALLDVGSHSNGATGPASDDASCTFASVPDDDLGGAGGGAGGSFGAIGGDGGTGDADSSIGTDGTAVGGTHGPVGAVTLRGGCRGQTGGNEASNGGQGGPGGHAGGALYLYAAQSIKIAGQIRATGAGGTGGDVQAGGGGGGSGGIVIIESPSIMIPGQISANGGGGGEGGGRFGGDVSGNPGMDGALGTMAAAGGSGTDIRLGSGGAGGASMAAAPGQSSNVGAGGGGGGVGIVHLIGTSAVTGTVSPPAT